jgi:hypothetical protein
MESPTVAEDGEKSCDSVHAIVYRMTAQDMLTIAVLVTVVVVALLFPGGPGTPRRFKLLN